MAGTFELKGWRIRLPGWAAVQPTDGALSLLGLHFWERSFFPLAYPANLDPIGAA